MSLPDDTSGGANNLGNGPVFTADDLKHIVPSDVHRPLSETTLPLESEFFEIKEARGKGLGLFAKEDIPAKTCIGAEYPIFAIKKPLNTITSGKAIAADYRLPFDAKRKFAKLRNVTDVAGLDASHRQTVASSKEAWIYGTNQHNIHGCYDNQTGSMTAVYRLASLFNHSCHPSMTIGTTRDGKMQKYFWTIQSVRRGQELTFSYVESALYMTSTERAETFQSIGMPSPCLCKLCILEPSLREISDKRRFLLRRLLLLLQNGTDINRANKIDIDGTLAKAAEVADEAAKVVNEAAEVTEKPAETADEHGDSLPARWLILFARLAQREGVVGDHRAHHAYTKAVVMLIERSKDGSSGRLSPASMRNVQDWWERSEQIVQKIPIFVEEDKKGRAEMSRVIEAIGADGEIPAVTKAPSGDPKVLDIRDPVYLMLTERLAPTMAG